MWLLCVKVWKKFSYLLLIMWYMFLSKVNVTNEDKCNYKYIARQLKAMLKDPPVFWSLAQNYQLPMLSFQIIAAP